MKKVYVCGIITILCIAAAILLRGPMDNAALDYTEVSARVLSSETNTTRIRSGNTRTSMTSYDVLVSYGGKEYELKNAHNSYSYREGATVTAYLSNGKLYANVEGIRSSTPVAYAYFAALIGSFVMFFVTICLWANAAQQRRNEKKQQS
ncbi:MAG: penicillin-binding protein [Butyrivibrio sp.]|nr:penicillin-binding protein [Acetatifactor muris]MCM1560927.1 penicillin-binding protein [Butyrivibrio sp.]